MTQQGYTWRSIFQIALQHKRQLILAHIIAIIATLVSVPIPLLMPLLVDEVLLNQPAIITNTIYALFPPTWHGAILVIITILIFTLILRIVALFLHVFQTKQFTHISKDVVYQIREHLVSRLQHVSMREYETLGSGQVVSHLVTDLDTIDEFISNGVSKLLLALFTIIGTASVLLLMHWQLGLFILLMNPLVIYFTIHLGRKVKKLKKHQNAAYAIFQQTLTETLEAIQQIRAYNREQHYLNRVIQSADQIRHHAINFTWKTDAATRLSFSIFLLGFDIFRAVGMLMVLFSNLTIGEMLAIFGYLWFMLAPMQEVLNIQYSFHAAKAALQRINCLFDLSQEPHYPQKQNPFTNNTTTSIRLDNICFSYEHHRPVLDHISLNIKAGEKVALVGASGGGKTTLIQILLGLYLPKSGQIYFNDIPLTEIGLQTVRENIATVLQHPALFNETLGMNLTLGKTVPEEDIWQALKIAQLDEFVKTMEKGLDTIIGRQGVRLSGGQQQRVACARMILANPKIVILDEATSALDVATEHRLHVALNTFLQNKTTIIVAHRLSAVKQADRIYVFGEGKIIETGQHEQLIQEKGLYAKLYASQLH